MKNITLFFLVFLVPLLTKAEEDNDQCAECKERKSEMCNEECLRVEDDRSLECISNCIQEYCTHKCNSEEAPTTSPQKSLP